METLPLVGHICSLEQALNYECEEVIYRFMETYSVSYEEAAELFSETKKWLWLNARAQADGFAELALQADFLAVDEMWHTFILFTEEYTAYCHLLCGRFLHHAPSTRSSKAAVRAQQAADAAAYEARRQQVLDRQYEYIYDHLGQDTLATWYLKYPVKYSREVLNQLRRPL